MNGHTIGTAALVSLVVASMFMWLVGNDSQPQEVGGGTRFPNGISADSTSPSPGEVRGADLTLTDDAVITDDLTVAGIAGVGSSTPTGGLSVGTAGATSTIYLGKFCVFAQNEAGTGVYIKIDLNSSNVFSTSTSACDS